MQKNILAHTVQVMHYPPTRKFVTQVPFSEILVEFWVRI